MPADSPVPEDDKGFVHIGFLALQVMFAGWGPMGDLFYGVTVLLLEEPKCYKMLTTRLEGIFRRTTI